MIGFTFQAPALNALPQPAMPHADTSSARFKPSLGVGLVLYFGYLVIVFATWVFNGVDYQRIGESVETTRLGYALPTLLGCSFLVVALTWLGWWRQVLFDSTRLGPRWLVVLPVTVAVVIASNLLGLQADRLGADLLLWSALGALGVGFGEEMITRGSLVVGLRSRFGEGRQGRVWLISTLLFSAMHVPNVFFGLPLWAMPFQVLLTFIMGTALYLIRRHTGTLIVPMVLHGLWDSSLFLSVATGREPSPLQFVVYPLTVLCAIAVVRRGWR